MSETETTPDGAITQGTLVFLPAVQAVCTGINDNTGSFARIMAGGKISDVWEDYLLSAIIPIPAGQAGNKTAFDQSEAAFDAANAIASIKDAERSLKILSQIATAIENRMQAVYSTASATSRALADLPARLDALTTQAGLLAGQMSAAQSIEVGDLHQDGPIWTRRDLAAHAALTGLMTANGNGWSASAMLDDDHADWFARRAYALADAMERAASDPRTTEGA